MQSTHTFIHIDADIIVWEPFGKDLLSGSLTAQNIEKGTVFNWSLFTPHY
ncbi:MAG: hypothetical protein PW786_02310 [Arachidicoccus sp.]|nr:hypothetical protein [Arachidicoccus sp.]